MTTYLKYINPFKLYPMQLVGTAICTLLYVSFNALSLWLVAPVLNAIFLPGRSSEAVIPVGGMSGVYETLKGWTWQLIGGADTMNMLPRLCIALIIVFAIKNIFAYGQMHFVSYVEQRMIRDLRERVFAHLTRQPYTFYDARPTGELMSNVMNDVNVISVAFQRVFTQAVRDPLTVITLLFLLISISWKLTLLAAVIVPLFGLIYRYTGQSLKRKSGRIQRYLGEMSSHLQEAISGARLVKAFGTEAHETARFARRNEDVFRHSLRLVRLDRMAQPVSETIGVVIIALVLLIGGKQVLLGDSLDAEAFIRYIVLLFAILAPIRGVGSINNNLQMGAAAGARLDAILDQPPEILDKGTKTVAALNRDIVFDHVSFRYPTSPDWVLKGVSLTIQRNEKIALVGRSGSGKSTLANLIPRFYDPQQGKILLDGIPLSDLTLKSLRRNVSTVSQDIFLFNETVRYNIGYGLETVDDAKLHDVIGRAQAADFIAAMPHGLDTMVGERGTQLSGGQRQRLAIARALLRNAPILIFDEATSSLDSESERLIQRALETLFHDRTVIIIAHRLSSIRFADRVVVMDKGGIVAQGTHTELLEKSPLYASLTQLYEQDVSAS